MDVWRRHGGDEDVKSRNVRLVAAVVFLGSLYLGRAPELAAGSPALSPTSANVVAVPVTFQVVNTDTSGMPCPFDGATYTARGHLTGPASLLTAHRANAV